MAQTLSLTLYTVAAVGLVVLALQLLAVWRHVAVARDPACSDEAPGLSILKPLCGDDDDLAGNLEAFATLDYPRYELLLGVEHMLDAAVPIALAAQARWPDRVRVVVQRGAPGLNPKVSQLMTLAGAARHGILVVSDSNVRPPAGYLDGIAAHLADPTVGLVTHAIVGAGAERLGSMLDALHLSSAIGPGVIAAKRFAGKDIVVGKSMALRAADLAALGGFAVVKDVLAEDYVLGLLVPERLGKRVVVARAPVTQVTQHRSVGDFVRRYLRWQVIHRQAVSRLAYAGELALNPVFLALVAAVLGPAAPALAVVAAKAGIDAAVGRLLGAPVSFAALAAGPLKDLLVGYAWTRGLVADTIVWRGHRLRVMDGTRLEMPPAEVSLRPRLP
jgi:ceramide glucosyltransferase